MTLHPTDIKPGLKVFFQMHGGGYVGTLTGRYVRKMSLLWRNRHHVEVNVSMRSALVDKVWTEPRWFRLWDLQKVEDTA